MRLIDILNKIANGELKEGTKVIWDFKTYTYDGKDELWRILEGNIGSSDIFEDICTGNLNEECELIEPNHFTDVGKMAEATDNAKIEELDADYYEGQPKSYTIRAIINKLNEVIRHINKGG